MKRRPKVFLKYLTPSSPRCDSRSRTPLYIDASPASLLFSTGPRFPALSCVRSNQSYTSFSHLNHEVGPSKSGGIFTVVLLGAVQWSVASARHAPPDELADERFEEIWTPIESSSQSLTGEQQFHNKTSFVTGPSVIRPLS